MAVFASLFFFAVWPCIFNGVLAAAISFGAYEVYHMAENVLEMLNKVAVELNARSSRENLINQVTKNTFAARSIINIINPNINPILIR